MSIEKPHRLVQRVVEVRVDFVIKNVEGNFLRHIGRKETAGTNGLQSNSRVLVVDSLTHQLNRFVQLVTPIAQDTSCGCTGTILVAVEHFD